jgi:hypothetical protein
MASTTAPANGPTTSTAARPAAGPTTGETLSLAVAGRLIDGLAARDFDLLVDAFDPEVAFRALLPRRVLEVRGTDAVHATFTRWFGGAQRWEVLEAVLGEVGGRVHLRWRVRLTDPAIGEGAFLVEQVVYADAGSDGRLRDVALLCTGYRPEAR